MCLNMFPLALYFVPYALPKVVLLECIQVSQYWELYVSMFGDYTFIVGSLQIFKKGLWRWQSERLIVKKRTLKGTPNYLI